MAGVVSCKGELMKLAILVFSGLVGTSAGVEAQERRFDCSQAKDPKACEERMAKMKATHAQAEKACEGKQGAERRESMLKSMCAQQQDPKACEERASKAQDAHRDARAACEGKQGDEHPAYVEKQICAQS